MEQMKIFDLIRGEEPRSIGKTVLDTRDQYRKLPPRRAAICCFARYSRGAKEHRKMPPRDP